MSQSERYLTNEQLESFEQLYFQTTPGEWKSWIEGRDGDSGSNFISTSGDNIELTGATESDQDFIAMAHTYMPRFIEELKYYRAKENETRN